MEYYKYITDNNISDYESLVQDLTQKFNIKFKEDGDLFLMYQDIDEKQYNDVDLVRNCNGLIAHKSDLKIACYSFDKCLEVDENSNTIHSKIDLDNIRVEKTYEGSLIRVYYYNNKWHISTKKCIDASKAYWISKKSFYDLFLESLSDNFDFNNLSVDNCYSFLLCHPENNIIEKNNDYKLYHLSTRNINSLEIVDHNINIIKPFVYNYINKENIAIVFYNLDLTLDGYMLIDIHGNRQKIESNVYKKIKLLWGNTTNRVYRYLDLRKNESDLKDYAYYFTSDCILFKNIEKALIKFGKRVHAYYMSKNIKKTGEQLVYPYNKITYSIHGQYLKNRYPVTLTTVMYYLNQLDVKQLYHYLNIFINDKEFHGSEQSPLLGYIALDTNIAIIDSNPDQYPDNQNNSDNYFQLEESSYQIETISYQDENQPIIIEPLIVDMD